ncbi:Alkaline phosphatase, partial [Smittium culicis]
MAIEKPEYLLPDSVQALQKNSISESYSSLLTINDYAVNDELPTQAQNGSPKNSLSLKKKIVYFVLGSAFISSVVLMSRCLASKKSKALAKSDGPINVILMISDGFGPASETMARQFYQSTNRLPVSWKSPLDDILVGASRTQSSDSLITDSAAGATAFSCAMKSYNGAIGVDPSKNACGTLLEAAKLKGMFTGLVATSRITHATPGSFSAHVVNRDMEDLIAQYQIGNFSLGPVVDLMLGGGKCFFLPKSDPGSCRQDDRDLISEAKNKGFTSISSLEQLNSLDSNQKLPLMGLFSGSHMDYEIDRDPSQQPSLSSMADKAIKILSESSSKANTGFFLMIEGSRIDMAAHSNDPATHVREIIAYWDTVKLVRKFVDENPNTVVISVSDHETGGLSVAKQLGPEYPDYFWKPEALVNVKMSIEKISKKLLYFFTDNLNSNLDKKKEFVKTVVFAKWLEIHDFN